MNFWRFIKAAWRFNKSIRSIPEANDMRFWTENDAKWLNNALSSYSGQKLLFRLTNYAFQSTMSAVKQKGNLPYECGEAAGIQLGIAALEEHRISHVSAQPDTSESEALDGLELEPNTS